MLRSSVVAALLFLGIALAPGAARADGPAPQLSFLARYVTTMALDRLALEDQFLIRLPSAADVPPPRAQLALPGRTGDVVALLGRGLDVATPGDETSQEPVNPVLLQLKPTFARRGGVVRFTFRF